MPEKSITERIKEALLRGHEKMVSGEWTGLRPAEPDSRIGRMAAAYEAKKAEAEKLDAKVGYELAKRGKLPKMLAVAFRLPTQRPVESFERDSRDEGEL